MFRRLPQAGRALWRAMRAHPRKTVLVVLLALAVLGVGGYFVGQRWSGWRHWRQAEAAADDGDYAAAIAHLHERLKLWPEDADTHLLLARLHRLATNHAEAARHLRAADKFRANRDGIGLESLLLEAEVGNFQRVESIIRGHIEAGHAQRPLLLEGLIRSYLARGRADDAQQWATRWLNESPDDWRPWYLRALARQQLSRELLSTVFEQATRDYQRVVELKPRHATARILLANAYTMTGQFREALPHLRTYCEQKPDDAVGIVALAGCLRALGQMEEARAVLDEWLAAHPGTDDTAVLRGQVALDLGKPEEALRWLRRAEALTRFPEKTHYHLSLVLRAVGRTDEAAAYEEKWRTHRDLTARLQELQQLAAKDAKNVAARHEAGAIALRLDQEDVGLRLLAAALRLEPGHRPTHQTLAEHFRRKGNHEAAEHHRRWAEKGR